MTSNPTQHDPQLGPALALVQLLTLHPELPRVDWTVSSDAEGLTGTLLDAPAGAMDAFVAALDGEAHEPWMNPKTGRVSRVLDATFQDVRISVVIIERAVVSLVVAA